MSRQDTFTAEEWTQLRLAPSFVAGGVAAADPSGIFGSIKEAASGAQGMADARESYKGLELFAALAADRSMPAVPDPKTVLGEGSREQQMANLKAAVLARVEAAVELVARKGSQPEADAYRKMLIDVAQRVAGASKEGGFLGFGGVRVSDKEASFIGEVKRAAGVA